MQCTNCGQPLAPGTAQCNACGAPVATVAYQPQPQPQSQPNPNPYPVQPYAAAPPYGYAPQPPQPGSLPGRQQVQPQAGMQPVPPAQGSTAYGQQPMQQGQGVPPSAPSAVPPEVSKNAAITAKLAVAVAVLNALLTVFLGVGATDAGKTNYLAMLLILLPTGALLWFGLQLLKASKASLAETENIIRQRILPIVAAAALIGLLSGSGGIGLLPIVMVFFAVRTMQKISEVRKRIGSR